MFVVRPITKDDLEAVFSFAKASNSGIINLPKNREILQKRIHHSIVSFEKHMDFPINEVYFFVLEDESKNEVVGVCGVYSKISNEYYYHLETTPQEFENPHTPKEITLLSTIQRIKETSEICALYLTPHHRKGGLGKLLSLSRFMFIASFRNRFEDTVIAEMRGHITSEQVPPFYLAVGKHFYHSNYVDLIKELEIDKSIIPHIIPKHPVYTMLLPKEAQECIGKVHANTKPALEMLLKEGFNYTHDVDLFDAGPKIQAKTDDIRLIRESSLACIIEIAPNHDHNHNHTHIDRYIICNAHLDFRACLGHVEILSNQEVRIDHSVAQALKVNKGDFIRFAHVSPTQPTAEGT